MKSPRNAKPASRKVDAEKRAIKRRSIVATVKKPEKSGRDNQEDSAQQLADEAAGELIGKIKEVLAVGQLDEDTIVDLMLHCASVLAFKRAQAGALESIASKTAGVCYRGVGGSSRVTLWSNGFAVGTCTRQEAKARGISACG